MPSPKQLQLAQLADSRDPSRLFAEVSGLCAASYGSSSAGRLEKVYRETRRLFEGNFPGYRACAAEYHDLRHTLSVALAAARLADGYNLKRAKLPEGVFQNLLAAAFLHDAGYIQEGWDSEGTGAKYAQQHEQRSVTFLERNRTAFGIEAEASAAVARLIQATDLNLPFTGIPFADAAERDAGALLGTADLLSQMSDRDYLERLLFLYYEFREAGIPGLSSEYDVLRRTGEFYALARRRLKDSFLSMYALARPHFRERHGVDANLYLIAISRQMNYLRRILRDETTNFRTKLKRGDRERREQLSRRPRSAGGGRGFSRW